MRVTPSKTMVAMKRSYFNEKMVTRVALGGGVEAMKGIYQSIRMAQVWCTYVNNTPLDI